MIVDVSFMLIMIIGGLNIVQDVQVVMLMRAKIMKIKEAKSGGS